MRSNKMLGTKTSPINYGYPALVIYFFTIILYLSIANTNAQNIVPFPTGENLTVPLSGNIPDEQIYTLKMEGATTTRDNEIVCTGFILTAQMTESGLSIIGFEGVASASVVHHMTLYGCDSVPTKACGCGMTGRSPLYSWVRNTPKVRYTGTGSGKTGGFLIGSPHSSVQYLFLEIHYHAAITNDQSGIIIHTTTSSPEEFLAIYPIMGLGTIPANRNSFYMDTCTTTFKYGDSLMHYVAFQVHTHSLGRLVSGYVVNNDQVTKELGHGNPLWPEAYIEITPTGNNDIKQSAAGDSFITRCVYDSSGISSDTNTNGRPKTNYHEMCIFNLVVASNEPFVSTNAFLKGDCTSSALIDGEVNSYTLLDPIPDLAMAAAYGNITTGTYTYGSSSYTINMDGEYFIKAFG